jgi:tRNA/rRNA methyltransferase
MSDPKPPAVILMDPQLAENIGAAARVMANFGLDDLRIVRPRDGWPQERAWVAASGADWPLDNARICATVDEAVADLQLIFAATARPRETQLPIYTPRQAMPELRKASGEGLKTAIMFGPERAGLETSDIALTHAILTVPVDDRFRSLNLAQTVAVCAYEWRAQLLDAPREAFHHNVDPPVSGEAMLGLYEQLEGELEDAGFFHPPEKKPSMQRNLRIALGRARFTDQELRTFRGVVTALSKGRGRVLAKRAAALVAAGKTPADRE